MTIDYTNYNPAVPKRPTELITPSPSSIDVPDNYDTTEKRPAYKAGYQNGYGEAKKAHLDKGFYNNSSTTKSKTYYEDGYKEGYDEGYAYGYEKGMKIGQNNGLVLGLAMQPLNITSEKGDS